MLANSVITFLPSYNMQIQWYQESICDYLDRAASRFIWKGSNSKGLYMASWNKMTKLRKHGGLGIRVVQHQNVALLGKIV